MSSSSSKLDAKFLEFEAASRDEKDREFFGIGVTPVSGEVRSGEEGTEKDEGVRRAVAGSFFSGESDERNEMKISPVKFMLSPRRGGPSSAR